MKMNETSRDDLLKRLRWLTFLRALIITFLLGATAIIQIKEGVFYRSIPLFYLYILIITIYILTIIYIILLHVIKNLNVISYIQIVGDILFVTVLIYITGGIESIFSFMYILTIINASILLFLRGALISASISAILYGSLIDLEYYGIVHPIYTDLSGYPKYEGAYILFNLFINIAGFFLVSYLSSYLAESFRKTEIKLKEKENDYKNLEAFNINIIQSIDSGLLTVDNEGKIRFFNRKGEEIIGLKFKEIYNKRFSDIFPNDIDFSSINKPYRWEAAFRRKDGINVLLGFSLSPLKDSKGLNIGSVLVFQDLTKIREMKERISLEEKINHLKEEKEILKKDLKKRYNLENIIGKSDKMIEIYELIEKVAKTKSNILIVGESGTGKELVAKAIHINSPRKNKPFMVINCGAIPETLMESELFGYKKGAFTGATSDKIGLIETANGGTIFFDEIGELPPSIQVKLLRVIQEHSLKRIGGREDISLDIRIISATNRDLEKEVKNGNFREDLFFRLNVIQIRVPPLRERKEDIPVLVQYFIDKYSKELNKKINKISSEAMKMLIEYDYPGNIRELENIIERSITLEKGNIITKNSLPFNIKDIEKKWGEYVELPINLEKYIEDLERNLIIKALMKSNGIKKKTAELLNITLRSLRYKLVKYKIREEEYKQNLS
jgi:two-component system response regulator PilR (NtrC family)